ncbi:MAG: dodecin domain-containing protein [Myxococcales bacterium]|nr:dodecin domain-containing protein [Myxococcales bacterium]
MTSKPTMAKVIELTCSSPKGFDDAIRSGLERAKQTVDEIQGAWIKEQKVIFQNGQVSDYRVDMKVTFLVNEK